MNPSACIILALIPITANPALHARQDVEWGPWYRVGPFDQPGGSTGIARDLPPEKELARMRGGRLPDLEKHYRDRNGERIYWQRLTVPADVPNADQLPIELTDGVDPALTEKAAAYLYRTITSPDVREVRAQFGTDDGMRLWLNGELLVEVARPSVLRSGEYDLALPLAEGPNHLMVEVVNDTGRWAFELKHGDELLSEARKNARDALDEAVDRGVAWLLSNQARDGSWGFNIHQDRNGMTGLCTYTLLKAGISHRHHALQRALAFMTSKPPRRTYSAAAELMALAQWPDDETLAPLEELTRLVLSWQQGGFGYPSGDGDLSNTQYAALGLRAAAQRGIEIEDEVWRDLLRDTLLYQTQDGGFAYKQSSRAATGSMTAAGITVLDVCLEQLAGRGGVRPREQSEAREACEAGLAWLAEHFDVRKNPQPHATDGGNERWYYYFIYGLERVGGLEGVDRIGGRDWHWEGVQELIKSQKKDGNWGTVYGEGQANTCFALLFLLKATSARSGQAGARSTIATYGADDPAQEVNLRASGDVPLTVWVSSFGDDARMGYEWPAELDQGLRVVTVEYLADGEVVQQVAGDPDEPAGPARFAAQIGLDTPGAHAISARVTVLAPGGEERVTLESAPLTVVTTEALDPWMVEYATDATRNLLPGSKFEASASSKHGDFSAGRAADGLLATGWACAAGDSERRLSFSFTKPVRANTLLLSAWRPSLRRPSEMARPTLIEVRVNRRKEARKFELDPDSLDKTVIELPRTESLRALELRILELEPGGSHKEVGGFAEVEVQLRKGGKKRKR